VNIAGEERFSLVDWPGRISAVVFTPGCNFDCYYCHNRILLGDTNACPRLEPAKTIAFLKQRQGLLDGVVISGGEPTLQPGLRDFIEEVCALGFDIKLDTNGTRPAILADLLERDLLDYVAMDIKGPWEKYEEICGTPVDLGAVEESVGLLLEGETDYEFRTTVAPPLTEDDMTEIGWRIRGAKRYFLQRFRRPAHEVYRHDPRLDVEPYPVDWFQRVLPALNKLVDHCETRGVDLPAQTPREAIAAEA
jgi:pyruvate formate lyase activating enzyme